MDKEKELSELRAEIRQELLSELQTKPTRKDVPALKTVKEKWFFNVSNSCRCDNSRMGHLFHNDQHKVWDSVRTLTRVIFAKANQSQLIFVDQAEVEAVCDSLCKLIYTLKEKAEQNTCL